jgi:quercetin dioxygenase-like cupin family protein
LTPRHVVPAEGEWILGGRHQVKIPAAATGRRFAFWVTPSIYGDGPPLHRHEHEDELFVVLEGAYDLRIDGQRWRVAAPSGAVLPRGVPHSYRGAHPGATSWALQMVAPGGLEDYLRVIGDANASTPGGMAMRRRVGFRFGLTFPPDPEPFQQPDVEAPAPWTGGAPLPVLAAGTARATRRLAAAGFAVDDVEIGPEARWSSDAPEAGSALFVAGGEGRLAVAGAEFEVSAGDTVSVPAGATWTGRTGSALRVVQLAAPPDAV